MKLYRSRPHYRSYSTIRPEAVNFLFLEITSQINHSDFRPFGSSRFKKDISKFSYSMSKDHSMDCDYKKATITLRRILYYQHPINGRIPSGMGMINPTNMSYRYLRLCKYKSRLLGSREIIRYPHTRKRMRLKIGLVYIYLHKFRRKA